MKDEKTELRKMLEIAKTRFASLVENFDNMSDSDRRIAAGDVVTPLQIIEEGFE